MKTYAKTLKIAGLVLATGSLIAVPSAFADNSASAYHSGGMIGAAALEAGGCDAEGYCKVLETVLSNAGTPKDLVIGLSFETMLMTNTSVKSKGGSQSTSMADAVIKMKVLVDGVEADPGVVTFDRRTQTLWAKLGGVMDCTDLNGDGVVAFDECTLTDEEIGLILDTTQASTFNFLKQNIGSGSHTITAYAQLTKDGQVIDGSGAWDASAALGKGTLSVWEVHGAVNN